MKIFAYIYKSNYCKRFITQNVQPASFWDSYYNQLIHRMRYMHREQARIVDKWTFPINELYHIEYFIAYDWGTFLCKITMCDTFEGMIKELYENKDETSGALFCNNRNLMVFSNGFKEAAEHVDEKEAFLNS